MWEAIEKLLNRYADLVEAIQKHRVAVAIGVTLVLIGTILGILHNCKELTDSKTPAPAPLPTPAATTPSPTSAPAATIAPAKPLVHADIIKNLELAHDPQKRTYEFTFDLRLRNTGNASEQITRCTAFIDVPGVTNRKYTVSDQDFSFWQKETKVSEIPVIQKDSSEIVNCKISLWDTPEFRNMLNDPAKPRELVLLLFGEENRSYLANFSFEITDPARQTLLNPKNKSFLSFAPQPKPK
jgi:hypothetical protein